MVGLAFRCVAAALLFVAIGSHSRAMAQDYPSKNITIVVSLGAGTGMDVLTRLYADKLQTALGKPVVVENKPGAATMLAAAQVANAPADGYTLVVLTSSAMALRFRRRPRAVPADRAVGDRSRCRSRRRRIC